MKKEIDKKFLITCILLASASLVIGCPRQINNQEVKIDLGKDLKEVLNKEDPNKKVRTVTIFPEKVSLNIGEQKKLTATIKYTDDTTDTNVTWDNSNPKVVTITPDGTLLALSSGQVTLTAIATKD